MHAIYSMSMLLFLLIEAALIGAVQNVYFYRYKLGACAYSGNWYRNSKLCFHVLRLSADCHFAGKIRNSNYKKKSFSYPNSSIFLLPFVYSV